MSPLTAEIVQQDKLREAMERGVTDAELTEIARQIQPADLASFLQDLTRPEALRFLERLEPDLAAEVLTHLDPEHQYHLLDHMDPESARAVMACMPSDAILDVAGAIHPRQTEILLQWLPEEYRRKVRDLMTYPDYTAGSLASVDYVAARETWTVDQTLAHVRKVGPRVEVVSYIYVLDAGGHLVGVVSLRELIVSPGNQLLSEVMNREVITVPASTDQEQTARLVARYDLVALPVVDDVSGRMVGIVTVDDLLDVIEEEATEDIQRLGGTQPLEEPYVRAGFFTLFRKRVGWLLVLLLAEGITATVLRHFEFALMQVVALSFFIPLLIGTAGNAGSQAATLVIRAMAVGEVGPRDYARIILRESWLGLALGSVMAVAGFIRAIMLAQSPLVALTVALALVIVVTISTTIGTILPLIGRRLGADPAVFSAPLITTVADGIGLFVYFEIARRVLGLE